MRGLRFFMYILLPLTGGGWVGVACSDFNDYNTTPTDSQASGNQTLWDNIQNNAQLTDFAALVKRTGFNAELTNTRTYTVWAPLNGTFSVADYQSLSDSALLQQFVKGHIAQYGHIASGQLSERIHMLNNKSFDFEGNGTYTLGGINVTTANLPNTNGMLHLMSGAVPFYHNLYEYIMSNKEDSLLRQYFEKYELTYLDTKNSVKGPVVNGMQTYIDSVMVTNNSLLNTINARLSNEDSTYTFILPNDKAYSNMYAKVKPYYHFINTTTVQDVEKFKSASSKDEKSVTVNATLLSDSLTRRTILYNLTYSNNDAYNRWLVGKDESTDTMRSTTRTKISNPEEVLSYTTQKQTMSNGYVHTVDSVAFYPWETYLPELDLNPLYYTYTADSRSRFNFSTKTVSVDDPMGYVFGPEITSFRYLWIYPTGDYVKPEIFMELPNVMSATYNFYCVFLPAKHYVMTEDSVVVDSLELWSDARPNILNFQLNYCDANGKTATYSFSKKFLDSGKATDENPKTLNLTTAFANEPLKTDTVYLGQFTFPVAYNGLGEDFSPNLHISCPISVFNKAQMSTYTRDVRIAAIIMKPIELVEFEEKQKK